MAKSEDPREGMRLATDIKDGRHTGSSPSFTFVVVVVLLLIVVLAAWRVLV
jgi:hypothetical protein